MYSKETPPAVGNIINKKRAKLYKEGPWEAQQKREQLIYTC
jgi:hypothetical protein